MNLMTPEEAQWAIHDAEYVRANLPGECWRALETVAGMRTEYRAEYQSSGGRWFPAPHCCANGSGWGTKQQAERNADDWKDDGYTTRIVRRYVTEPEAADARWNLPSHRTEAGFPNCSTCDGGGCPDCTDPA